MKLLSGSLILLTISLELDFLDNIFEVKLVVAETTILNGIRNVMAPRMAYYREASGHARSPTSARFRARFETAMILL